MAKPMILAFHTTISEFTSRKKIKRKVPSFTSGPPYPTFRKTVKEAGTLKKKLNL
jgi:hypothetical protein